jgi:polyhydroxybutyrate depolymerase
MLFDLRIRSYRLHIPPSYDGKTAVPLVIILHGNTSNSHILKSKANFDEKADEDGFIVVYPNGYMDLFTGIFFKMFFQRWARSWNGEFCCWKALEQNIDDVGFIKALIENLHSKFNIDSSRIFVAGSSNGGIMTYRLGAELSDIITAIGISGGSIGGRWTMSYDSPYFRIPEPEHSLPVIIIHGIQDETVPYEGNARFDSVNESVSFWVEHNNCDPNPEVNVSESGNIIRKTYRNGSDGTEVILYSVANGTHSWYGSADSPIQEISTTELIWEFFKRYPI